VLLILHINKHPMNGNDYVIIIMLTARTLALLHVNCGSDYLGNLQCTCLCFVWCMILFYVINCLRNTVYTEDL
jgi:hypothetical protein